MVLWQGGGRLWKWRSRWREGGKWQRAKEKRKVREKGKNKRTFIINSLNRQAVGLRLAKQPLPRHWLLHHTKNFTPSSHLWLFPTLPTPNPQSLPRPWHHPLFPSTPQSSIPAAPPVKYELASGASIRCMAPAKKTDHRYIKEILMAPPPPPDDPPTWTEATAAAPLAIDCNNPFHQNARWQVWLCRRSPRSARAESGAVTHREQWLVETGVISPLLPPSTAASHNRGISCHDLFHTGQSPTLLNLFL